MRQYDEVQDLFDYPLTPKFQARLRWIEDEYKKPVQNYYDGRVKFTPVEKLEHTCSHVAIPSSQSRTGNAEMIPPAWRKLEGEEAEQLWTAQVYRDCYLHIGVWAQHDYERAVEAMNSPKLREVVSLDEDGLQFVPDHLKGKAKAISGLKNQAKSSLQKMKEMSGRDVQRNDRGQKYMWRVGNTREGRAARIERWMREVAQEARHQRDIDFERMKNADVFRQESVKLQAQREAMAAAGMNAPQNVNQPVAVVVEDAPEPKPEKKRGRPKKKDASDE